MRFGIHVLPAGRHTAVGGSHDGNLVVRVTERPHEGKATRAAIRAVATAFGVPVRDVTLVTGATSRTKIVEVAGEHAATLERLLREAP